MKKIKALGMTALLLLACLKAVGAMGQNGEADISKEDIIGKTAEDVYFRKDGEIIGKMDSKLLKKGGIQSHEFSVIHSTKYENRDLILTKALFYDFKGNVGSTDCYFT